MQLAPSWKLAGRVKFCHVTSVALGPSPCSSGVDVAWSIMVEVVRNNFEDLFPEIKEAIEQSAFVGE